MDTYWLTFRIHDDAGYEKRRDALYDAISALTDKWWVESTSFVVFRSASNSGAICGKIKAAINVRTDLAVLGKTDFKSMSVMGKVDHFNTLEALVPFAQRV